MYLQKEMEKLKVGVSTIKRDQVQLMRITSRSKVTS